MPTGWDKQSEKEGLAQSERERRQQDRSESAPASEVGAAEQFISEAPTRRLDDVVLPRAVRARLETALTRIRFHGKLYEQWNLKKIDPHGSRVAINFYGPPGTGKTICAEAVAHYIGKTIITVNYAEIESKYVGDTPKNIVAAFRKAAAIGSVLFFDEADSILGRRLTSVTQSADHGVNVSRSVMLLQLDKFDGVVIFATNLARNYDSAFVRRILAHIEFELPDHQCRALLWKQLLPLEVPIAADIAGDWLAAKSEGLSGGDIRNVVIAAAGRAVLRPGDAQRVTRADILEEIDAVRVAQSNVGRSGSSPTTVREEIVAPEQLPPDARARYESVTNR